MEEMLQNLLVMAADQYPFMLSVFAFIGFLRAVNKPIFTLARAYVAWTKTSSDDLFLDKVEQSKAYRYFVFALDWLFSVKLQPIAKSPAVPPEQK